ncbi:MAG: LamG domain-containing protein, partial [Myxococcota bacterium]
SAVGEEMFDFLSGEPVVSPGQWTHVAITWTDRTKRIYVDGQTVAVGEADIAFDRGAVLIGADIDSGQVVARFNGSIDDVRIYSRALSGEELTDIMQP